MDSDRESLLRKIKALFKLGQHGRIANSHEAESAVAMAKKLMDKFMISQSEVDGFQTYDFCMEAPYTFTKKASSDLFISGLLPYFNVRVVWSREGYSRNQHMNLIGTQSSIEVAYQVFCYLKKTYLKLFKSYYDATGCPRNARMAYYAGLTNGLRVRLEAQHVEDNCTALVLVGTALDVEVKNRFSKLSKCSKRTFNSFPEATEKGMLDSLRVNFFDGINGEAEKVKVPARLGES